MEKKVQSADIEVELLQKVKVKEEEIEKSLQLAKSESLRRLADEKKKVEDALRKAVEVAEKEAENYKASRCKGIESQTDKLLSEAKSQARQIYDRAQHNLPEAEQLVLSRVFPSLAEKSRVPLEASS